MRLFRLIAGWLLATAGIIGAVYFVWVMSFLQSFGTSYDFILWAWVTERLVCAAGIFFSLAVTLGGLYLIRHASSNFSFKGKIIISLVCISLVIWLAAFYLLEPSHWT